MGDGLIIEGRKSSYKVDRKERENYGQVLSLTGCFTIYTVFLGGDKGCDSAQLKTVHCSVVVNINVLGCD